ncbi:MAG: leucyl aminopeptidase family protein, partial [Pontibacter sp.]|nr:leucyl aminopeptidase family protein [Pontibacter sp.]
MVLGGKVYFSPKTRYTFIVYEAGALKLPGPVFRITYYTYYIAAQRYEPEMPTQLKYDTSLAKNANLALITTPEKAGQLPELQPGEQQYVQERVQQEAKIITLNRYTHHIYIVVVPAAKTESGRKEAMRQAGFTLLKQLKADRLESITILDKTETGAGLYLAEGIYLSNYSYTKHKTRDAKPSLLQTITLADEQVTATQVQELANVLEAVVKTRDLVNEPHSHQNATQFSEQLEEMGREAGFKTEVLDEIKIQTLKMGGLLAVNQGSEEPATFTIMEWKPENAKNSKPYVLVGKGVVYDTGGLSLKPTPNSMDFMKSDMAGAAAV